MSNENKNSLTKTLLICIVGGLFLAYGVWDLLDNRFAFYGVTFALLIIGVILLIKSKFNFDSKSGLWGILLLGLFTVFFFTVFFLKS